jgi:hypothetical protein
MQNRLRKIFSGLYRDSRIILAGYLLLTIGIFLYSYTQVDLGLTLTSVNIWQRIQQTFQNIGYFQRPFSTVLYCVILALLFLLYGYVLHRISIRKFLRTDLWLLVFMLTGILLFSYPALSYDLFNHMFTAKTVLVYQKNPYTTIPLQFTGIEPWLSFMHWTHVSSIFSPLWIGVTLPAYILGFGNFLLTMWNTKLIIIVSYIVSIWAIGEILRKEKSTSGVFGMAVFALNPLVIIESLVNAHNDMMMMAFALMSLALYEKRHHWLSWLSLSFSIASKIITLMLIPAFILKWNRKIALVCMCIGLVVFLWITKREIMPWYMLWIIPFVPLVPGRFSLIIFGFGASAGALLRYVPFLYYGNWNPPVPVIEAVLMYGAIGLSCLIWITPIIFQKIFRHRSVTG